MAELRNATVVERFPKDKIKEIAQKHSCNFEVGGEKCRCSMGDGRLHIDGPADVIEDISALITGVNNLEKQAKEMHQVDRAHCLYRAFEMLYKFRKELSRFATYELVDSEPLDLESMPLEERCLFELMSEQTEASKGDGSKVFTVTKKMVEARMKQKLEEAKKKT
jgi:phenylalanyl-tRNA synthetase beta subunit